MAPAALPAMTERLVRFGLDLAWVDVPPEVIARAQTFLFDTLTVGVAGSATEEAARIRQAAACWGGGDEAVVIGRESRLPASQTAFVNGFQIHCLEWDCVHEKAVVHAMSVPTAALLAWACRDPGLSGRDLLMALIVSVDLAVNLGLATSAAVRFFRPATAGLMGAALGLARLGGAPTTNAACDVLGLAYSQVAGTMQAHVEGSIALPIQIAVAARAAVCAADLAAAGSTGPHDVLEGPFGYFTLIEQGGDLDRIANRLGRDFGIAELSHKPFPTGRAAHAVLDGLARVMAEEGLTAVEVERVDAFVPPLIFRLVSRRPQPDMAASYARLCLPFLVAARMVHGPLGPHSYAEPRLRCPATLELAERIWVHEDGTTDPNAMSPQRLTLVTRYGPRYALDIPDTLGAPRNPLTEAQCAAKAVACLEPVYGHESEARAASLREAVARLPDGDCRELISLLGR